jgi:hypothetical protein
MIRSASALAVLLSAQLLGAQSSAPDSVAALNARGRWLEAVRMARNWLNSNRALSVDDRCALRFGGMRALIRLGDYSTATNDLKVLDEQCASSTVIRERAADLRAARDELNLPPLPTAAMDFRAVDEFWRVTDLLMRDTEPTEAQWRAMFSTPGYRLSMRNVPSTREDMEIALRPSRRGDFDSVSKLTTDLGARVRHLARTVTRRAELAHYRDSLTRALPIADAVAIAAKFLPPRSTDGMRPPLVAFAIFRDDAYSLGPDGVVIDLEHVYEKGGLTLLLAHEFHHSFLSALSTLRNPSGEPSAALYFALRNMRNEGIADLIDKPYPLTFPPGSTLEAYAKRYNEAYARTPSVIRSIDSALVVAADDSTKLPDVGRRVNELLPSAGHFNGSYIAREIYETFGVDSLFPGVYDHFAFLRVYAAAEAKRGNPPPFSPKAMALLDALRAAYRRR